MFGFVARLTPKRIIAIIGLLAAISLLFTVSWQDGGSILTDGSSAQQRAAFLQQFGWSADMSSEQSKRTVIPEQFDEVYAPYNELQTAQGFDLAPLKGSAVTLYSIKITNYPERPESVYASLLVQDGQVVGGDIHSTELDGFMHGFTQKGSYGN